MRRALPFIVIFVIAAVGLAIFTRHRDRGELTLSGTVEARDVQVGSLVGGRVLAVHVEEGASVKAGDPLVTLDSDLLAHEVAQQESAVAEAEARLAALQAGPRSEEIARARIEASEAETERKRLARLRDEGVVSQQALDAQAAKSSSAQQQLTELQRGTRPEDVAAAEAVVESRRQQLEYAKRQQEEAVITAPIAARVQALDLRPGDIVAPNEPVADLVETDQVFVRLWVPETKLGLIAVGQQLELTADTFPDRRFTGHVASIRDRAEYTPRNVQTLEQRGDQVFGIRVEIDPAPELKPGMAVLARLPK